jgi:preprotein translocase subunit SecB
MKTANIQNAIRLYGFRVITCNFNCAEEISSCDFEDMLIDLQFITAFNSNEENMYVVKFLLGVKSKNEGKVDLHIEAAAFFESKDPITEEFKQSSFVIENSPAIAFPFLRSFVQTLCVNSGVPPIILPAVNFSEVEEVSAKS